MNTELLEADCELNMIIILNVKNTYIFLTI